MPSKVASEGYEFQSTITNRKIPSGSEVKVPNDVDAVDESVSQLTLVSNSLAQGKIMPIKRRSGWKVNGSALSLNTHNRIRNIVESLKIKPNLQKTMIPLSIGA